MRIQADISIGEWIDKLTILEIKLAEIGERDKLDNIRREYETLLAAAPDGMLADEKLQNLRGADPGEHGVGSSARGAAVKPVVLPSRLADPPSRR